MFIFTCERSRVDGGVSVTEVSGVVEAGGGTTVDRVCLLPPVWEGGEPSEQKTVMQ